MKIKIIHKIIQITFLAFFFLVGLYDLLAQNPCVITATADKTTICSGDSVILSSHGGCGMNIWEGFDTGLTTGLWVSNCGLMFNNPCPPSADGTIYAWFGPQSSFPRELTTVPLDLSSGNCIVSFDMKYAAQANQSPCEGPDLPTEGIHLQYSISGVTWVDINYWDPGFGQEPNLINWNNHVDTIPPAALSQFTQIRWYQVSQTNVDYDHWGLDNIRIQCQTSNSQLSWSHGPNISNPPVVFPVHDTTFVVTVTDTVSGLSASDSVFIDVLEVYHDFLGNDTSVLNGQQVLLTAPPAFNYLWSNGKTTQSQLINSSFITSGNVAEVSVRLNYNYPCMSSDTIRISFGSTSAVQECEGLEVLVSPNPGKGIFEIEFTESATDKYIVVYTSSGKKIYDAEILKNEKKVNIDLRRFADGIYFMQIQDARNSEIRKVLKVRK